MEKSDLELIQTTLNTVIETKVWPSGKQAVENLLVQVMQLLPNSFHKMLECLPNGLGDDLSNIVCLFERAKALTDTSRFQEEEGSYLTAQTMNNRDKGKTIIEELIIHTENYIPEGEARDALVARMIAELPDHAEIVFDTEDAEETPAEEHAKPIDTSNHHAVRKLFFSAISEGSDHNADDEAEEEDLDFFRDRSASEVHAGNRKSGSTWEEEPDVDVQALLQKIAEATHGRKSPSEEPISIDLASLAKLAELAKTAIPVIDRRDTILSDSDVGLSDQSHRDRFSGSGVSVIVPHTCAEGARKESDLLGQQFELIAFGEC